MKKKILLLLSLCLMLLVISCGKHPAVKDFEDSMKIIQSGDYGNNANMAQLKQSGMDEETLKALAEGSKKITYKINKTETKKDEAVINVTMKSPDLSGVQQELIQKITSINPNDLLGKTESEMEKFGQDLAFNLIKEKLESPELKFREKTFDVVYTKTDNKWTPNPASNLEFLDMTSFGLLNTGK